MNHFLERLPWRIAACAGLLVGGASWASHADLWVCLERVGAAFLFFGLAGVILRNIMQRVPHSATPADADHKGTHLDHTTPELSVNDVTATDGTPRRETPDESER